MGSEARREVPRRGFQRPLDDGIDRHLTESRAGQADPQDLPLGLHSATLELDLELATLRGRELLELAEPALEGCDCARAVLAGGGAADLTWCADACFSLDGD